MEKKSKKRKEPESPASTSVTMAEKLDILRQHFSHVARYEIGGAVLGAPVRMASGEFVPSVIREKAQGPTKYLWLAWYDAGSDNRIEVKDPLKWSDMLCAAHRVGAKANICSPSIWCNETNVSPNDLHESLGFGDDGLRYSLGIFVTLEESVEDSKSS